MNVGETIKAIRNRMKEPATTFALRLGVRQATVSRYESGKVAPSREVLIVLYQLAATEAEKRGVLGALGVDEALRRGWSDEQLLEAVKEFDVYDSARKIERDSPRAKWKKDSLTDFAEKATVIVKEIRDVDPALVEILAGWIRHHGDPRAVEDFRDAAGYLSVQLAKYSGDRGASAPGSKKKH